MKLLLMVAAGVAVGITAAAAVLIQVLLHLLPALIVLLVLGIVLQLLRRRGDAGHRGRPEYYPPAAPEVVEPFTALPALPAATVDRDTAYLRWGPVNAPTVSSHAGAGTHGRRVYRGGPRSGPGRRP